jgi:hypothetical protein
VEADEADEIVGAKIVGPARLKTGTKITARAHKARKITGLEAGGKNDR